jgi:hypothetical protein
MDDNVTQPGRNNSNWMKSIISIIFFLFSFLVFSQKDTIKFSLDDNINGSYSKFTDNNNIINVGLVGDNSLGYKKLKFNNVSNYSLSFRDSITANELVNKTNIEYDNIFLFNVYTNSLIRSIKNDNSFGIGYGHKFSIKKLDISISYAILYQKTFYRNLTEKEIGRNSVRTKIKYNGGLVGFSTEIYYQPSFKSMQTDYIIYGNAKIVFLPKKKINFILQDAINYISTSKVRMLHNLAFGIEYNFKN